MSGIELTRRLKQDHPDMRVLVVSAHDDPFFVRQALAVGADGYVLKDNIDTLMEDAARTVLSGQRYLCQEALDAV